jgi:hypothetical protein
MVDLTRYKDDSSCAELVEEIERLRVAGGQLAEVARLVAAEQEPLHPDCVKCEHFDQVKAQAALKLWRSVHE